MARENGEEKSRTTFPETNWNKLFDVVVAAVAAVAAAAVAAAAVVVVGQEMHSMRRSECLQ